MEYQYRLTKLPNGTRIATAEMPWMKSVSVGIWAAVGGRHESAAESGISHFIEHLLFKGTKRRNAKQITEAVEGVGGYLNAFTTEDHTCYYAKGAGRHLPRLCDVLSDMYVESQFDPEEIEREREVIREEIMMYRDQPGQHVQELLTQTMWPSHALGRPLTGTIDSISRLHRPELMGFMRSRYSGRTTIVTVAGRVTHDEAVGHFRKTLGALPSGRVPRFARWRRRHSEPRVTLHTQETEQTHLSMGFHTFGRSDERRYALKLLNVLLGENMSSRLFQQLRERYGFCYSVQSGVMTLADAGSLHISAGLDPSKMERALRLIMRELERLCGRAPSRAELRKAQDYTIGQTEMGLESTTSQIMWMGESVLGYGRLVDPGDVERRLLAVTPEDVQSVACHCLDRAGLSVAVVGPVSDADSVKRCLS